LFNSSFLRKFVLIDNTVASILSHAKDCMDNLTHSLAAWTLGRAGLARSTSYATTALVIGANMPDIDVFPQLTGGILAYLHTHRGNTHSLLGIVPQAIILTVLLGLINYTIRRKNPEHPQIRPLPLFVASTVGLLSHVLMDFPNNYGIRLLLPFSKRWSYGDFVFVADPWLVLVWAGAFFLATPRDLKTTLLWAVAGIILTIAIFWLPFFSLAVKGVWLIGLGGLIALRNFVKNISARRAAQVALVLAVAYYAMMFGFKQRAQQLLTVASRSGEITEQSVAPFPGNIFQWAAFRETEDEVASGTIDNIFSAPQIKWKQNFPKNFGDPFVCAALGTYTGQVMLAFSRYPAASLKEERSGYRVTLYDARYVFLFSTRGRNWAKADVVVHPDFATEEPEPCPTEQNRSNGVLQ
jgi:inner membrane protein